VLPEGYLELHPFGRVPVLCHDGLTLYEAQAIGRYVDEGFAGPALQPEDAAARARMAQVIGIVDAYGYWPLVRQVYSHAVFQPALGEAGDPREVAVGMVAAAPVLGALDRIADEGLVLAGPVTLADLHLAPMIAAFVQVDEGAAALARHPALARWWAGMRGRDSMAATDPGLPGQAGADGGPGS
jgi:glutathione S-transferase